MFRIFLFFVVSIFSISAYAEEKYTTVNCFQQGKLIVIDLKLKNVDYFKSEGVIVITGINEHNKSVRLVGLTCSLIESQ